MKGIVIGSNKSGGGKTTFTLGLMRALMNKGFQVQGYKVGPDYIDSAFHSTITGKASRNLDIFLMGEEGVKASFSRGNADIAVVEGVMGLYDGKGINSEYSTSHVAKLLDLPVVLVLSPSAQMATLCAEINGILNFDNVKVCGIILNNVSESYYRILKIAIESNCKTNVFGYIPKDDRLSIKSRHLGLIQSSEISDIHRKIDICAELIHKYVDLKALIENMNDCKKYQDNFHVKNKNMRTAVAYDRAFSFYYKENLEMLEEMGEVTFFSPIADKKIPENIDFLYIGGGYPEVFIDELSQNTSMLNSIYDKLNSGLKCFAECGGLMYLTKGLTNEYKEDELNKYMFNNYSGINIKETVGFFNGVSYMTKRLQNFGYAQIEVNEENSIVAKKSKINCHEFHRSKVNCSEKKIYKLQKETITGEIKQWECGYVKNNTLGAYAHIHFFGNNNFFK